MIKHEPISIVVMFFAVLGFAASPVASHAADEALASRDTTSTNLEDIVDGSSDPLVLVDDAMTTFTVKLPTALEDLLRLTQSGEATPEADKISATLTVGGIDRATTASVTFNAQNSDTTGTMTLLVDNFQVWSQAADGADSPI